MIDFVFWYLIITFLGWITFPVIYQLVPHLPGRGINFTKILGLLLWGYLYWILGRLGITANNLGGLFVTLLGIVTLGSIVFWKNKLEIRKWVRNNRSLILTSEILFLIAFLGWALIRSLNPEILGTEKPMELAFINAILNSESFPPHDPWLSGYAISYYYFGYILVAMLAKLGGTLGSVAFNLGVSLIFALAAVGSFGVLYNLLALGNQREKYQIGPALLAPFFTLIVSNWEGFLHYLHAQGIFWKPGEVSSAFWKWLDIQDLVSPPTGDSFGHLWWWRASRVIQDYDFLGNGREVISEFPFFSFLLADLHPHVLSLPFVFLILGFALELYLKPKDHRFRWLGFLPLNLSPRFFIVLAWLAGGMAFLNTWNFPMYVGLLAGAYVLRNNHFRDSWPIGQILLEFLYLGAALGVTGGVLFLPWYLGFASQAGGVIPNVFYVTRGNQFWVMFGPLLVPIIAWLFYIWGQRKGQRDGKAGLILSGILFVGLLLFMLVMVVLIILLSSFPYPWQIIENARSMFDLAMSTVGGADVSQVLIEGLLRRIIVPGSMINLSLSKVNIPGTLITLFLLSSLGFGLLFISPKKIGTAGNRISAPTRSDGFVVLIILGGMVLTLFPEFVYLRDLFGYRINTIFKFYYQAWLLWSIAAAFGMISLFRIKGSPTRYLIMVGLAASLAMGLFYPVISIQSKTNRFSRQEGMTLDGAYLFPASDINGVEWLRAAEPGVIAEAVGGSYSTPHARMATYSGKPNILGWDFHEIQWRGSSELVTPRKQDVATLYCTRDWNTAQEILKKYQVRYLVVGEIEYSTYTAGQDDCPAGLNEEKFITNMRLAFSTENLSIYTLPEIGY